MAEKKAPSPKENKTIIKISTGIKNIFMDGVIENQTISIAIIEDDMSKSGSLDKTDTRGSIILGK